MSSRKILPEDAAQVPCIQAFATARIEDVAQQQAEGGRGGIDFGVRGRGLQGGGIPLVIDHRPGGILDQHGPGVGGDRRPRQNRVNLIGNSLSATERTQKQRANA